METECEHSRLPSEICHLSSEICYMPATMSNHEIAETFSAVADMMEILGEDRFRIQAYRRAADAITDLQAPLASYRAAGTLQDIPNIGKAVADKIIELLDTGDLQFYTRLKTRIPSGVRELLRVPSIGPKTAGRLYNELGVASLADLRAAAEDGRLQRLKGFGPKMIAGILEGLQHAAERDGRALLLHALQTADHLLEFLRSALPHAQFAITGGLRRAQATVADLDLLATGPTITHLAEFLPTLPLIAQVNTLPNNRVQATLQNGLHVDIGLASPASWGAALLLWTGSAAHRNRLYTLAAERGLTLSDQGLLNASGTLIETPDEATAYAALGLPWIAPELREDSGEIEAALAGTLPDLITRQVMRADLHMHTTWSDGRADLRTMAETARALGYTHIAITDHGAYLGITNGLDPQRLRAQATEIAALNAEYAAQGINFNILRGVEVDITPEGSLALPDDVLADLDLVVASPHVRLQQPPEQATERLLRVIRNPHVDIIGHPTGRLIGERPGAPIDIEAVARAAAEHGTLLEVNSGPDRLDLDSSLARRALELGAQIAIDSDAHHPDNLTWISLGIQTARRAWAPARDVANTWNLAQLRSWLSRPRSI